MNRIISRLFSKVALVACLATAFAVTSLAEPQTLVSGTGTSGYAVPTGWTSSGTVEGGSYLKFDNGTITSTQFSAHTGLSFTYEVATFGSGTNHPLTIRIINASTEDVIVEKTTATPTSSSYISTGSPISLGDITVPFKIQLYAPTGKGVRLRNYSITGTPAGGGGLSSSDLALTGAPVSLSFDLYNNSTSQVINYTTSSTGTVTINDNAYASFSINESSKTITVTPTAVTPSAQTITVNQAADASYEAGSTTFTISVDDSAPYAGDDFVRVDDISYLTDGVKVVIAARHDSDATSYYAMTATATGKPTGVSFSSTTVANGEALPSSILNNLNSYYWTVGLTANGYTFTNKSGDVLGYTSSTNFATGGDNTEWLIERETSGNSAMVSGYEGFLLTNKNISGRGVALNDSNNYGPYATSNKNSSSYNFYVDIFVQGATVSVDPSISAGDVNIDYDASLGSIAYTINNIPSPAGTLTASTTSDWLTLGAVGATEVPFTCTANPNAVERTATVSLTYTYNTSETVTKNVTVTQAAAPVIYSTIPALFTAATGAETGVHVTFDSWVVSGISTNGKNVFVTDSAGNGFIIYSSSDMSSTYHVGDILSGTNVACDLVLYNGFAEIKNLDASDLTITGGGVVSVSNIAMSSLAGINTGAVVSYDDLTCSISAGKYYLSDGVTSIQVYNTLYAFSALENGKHYNITGVYQQYNSTKEILPRSAADIEEVVASSPSIYIGSTLLSGFSYEAGNGPSTSKSFTVSGEYLTENIVLSLSGAAFEMSTASNGVYSSSITLTPTAGDVSSTSIYVRLKANVSIGSYNGSIILSSAGAENKSVNLSGSVTAPDAPHMSWDLSTDQTATATTEEMSWAGTYASMMVNKAESTTNANNYYPSAGNYTSTRFYKNSSLTISPAEGYTITSVVFIATTNGYATALRNSTWTNATASADETTVTVTPVDGSSSFNATIGATCGFTEVKVYYVQVPASVTVTASLSEGHYWATFYNGSACYELPQGAKAYTLNSSNILYLLGDGSVIPANTAVIIIADTSGSAATIDLSLTKVTNTVVAISGGDNVLEGSDFDYPIVAVPGTPYVLGIPDAKPLGFYQFTGAEIPANKAYYVE